MQYDDLIRQLREVQQRIPDELIQRYLRAAINRLQRFKDDGTIIPRSPPAPLSRCLPGRESILLASEQLLVLAILEERAAQVWCRRLFGQG